MDKCPLECYRNRAVVGAVDVGVELGFFNTFYEFACDEEVVNAPADIAVARASE